MCIEKTPWEQVIDFHGHTCPGIALGFRISQIASKELGFRPSLDSKVIVKALTSSCALDAFQVLNHATVGKGLLKIEEIGKHVYYFQYSNLEEMLRISIKPSIIKSMLELNEITNQRQKQNKSLEIIQLILSSEEKDFCEIKRLPGNLSIHKPSIINWAICDNCGESVKPQYLEKIQDKFLCLECRN